MTCDPCHLYVAVLDVLAYRDHLEKDRKADTLEFQIKLKEALSIFDTVNNTIFHVRAISDTIIITCPAHGQFPEFLNLLKKIFVSFLRQKLFIRGGVAYSRHFQSNHLTYSHAIAKAHEIESTISVYPRIVLDDNIIEMYRSGEDLPQIFNQGLICCQNSIHFLNILDESNWMEMYALAKGLYEEMAPSLTKNENATIKHHMFERYLMTSCHADSDSSYYIPRAEVI